MKPLALLLLCVFLTMISFPTMAAEAIRGIAIVDNSPSNDVNKANLFSLKHAVIVAGVPSITTSVLDTALTYKIIAFCSPIEQETFNTTERNSLFDFVGAGGIIYFSQLKDTNLFALAGVQNYTYSNQRYGLSWLPENFAKEAFYFDDPNERTLKLGDPSQGFCYGTRAYTPSTAIVLAQFEDLSAAIVQNSVLGGSCYVMGINWRDIVLRNQVANHYKAARYFSNGFEPGSDVFYLFLREIYTKCATFGVHKHTSVWNTNSTVVITHDVDATSAIQDIMTDFSSYEFENGIKATYFITTHYMHDSIAKDFWTDYTHEVLSVKNKKHEIASHSVSHVPDFASSSIVPLGDCSVEQQSNYLPFYNGNFSTNVTVCGEVNVSKKLLEETTGLTVRSFRSGYLAYNKYLLQALEQTQYQYNSSQSANHVLTAFPFQGHLDLSMYSNPSKIYEIPNTISDVFMNNPISATNYLDKVAIWLDVQDRCARNFAPSILLIHPNRPWKLLAQQEFIRKLPPNTIILPFEEYADYWKAREQCDFKVNISNDSLVLITVTTNNLPMDPPLSFVVSNGKNAKQIIIVDENGTILPLLQEPFGANDIVLFSKKFTDTYTSFTYDPNEYLVNFQLFPNPSRDEAYFKFSLINDGKISLKIHNSLGQHIETMIDNYLELGEYKFTFPSNLYAKGMYFYTIQVEDEQTIQGKIIID
jgi:peptidoglycan/xylan/chitin deacetylase (PgdA/CDA1 family)